MSRDELQNSDGPVLDPRTDEAMRRRLGRLGAMPVDTSRLERALRAELPARTTAGRGRRWWRPMLAVAASVLIAASVALFTLPTREAQAAPEHMVQIYEEMVSGKHHVMQVRTVDEANAALAGQARDLPTLPRQEVGELHACCMHPLENKQVACLLLDYHGKPVTMSVAKASDFALPKVEPVQRDGKKFYCQSARGYQMVMTERNGTWVCLVSKIAESELVDVANKLRF